MIKKLIGWIIAIVVVGFVLLASASRFLTDWAWFDVVNYSQVFWTTLKWEWGVWIVTLVGVALFLFINLRITKKSVDQALWRFPQVGQYIKNKHITLLYLGLSIFFGVIVASGLRSYGLDIAVFFNQVPFNIAEPLFGRDVSFYIFSLPILKALCILLGVLVMTGF